MPGSYCRFCNRRCFVYRVMPADARRHPGRGMHLATCPAGAELDRKITGYDHTTARNPFELPQDVAITEHAITASAMTSMGNHIRRHAMLLGGGPTPSLRIEFDATDPGPWAWVASVQVAQVGQGTAERRIRMVGASPHAALAALAREVQARNAARTTRKGRTA